jgi:hypothetical protein
MIKKRVLVASLLSLSVVSCQRQSDENTLIPLRPVPLAFASDSYLKGAFGPLQNIGS